MTEISRVPPVIDLQLYAGDGVAIRFSLVDTASNPYPLDGLVTSQIKIKRSDSNPALAFSIDDTNLATGVVVLSLTGEQTSSLISNGKTFRGVWDLQFSPTGAEPITFIQGKVTCDADVTR